MELFIDEPMDLPLLVQGCLHCPNHFAVDLIVLLLESAINMIQADLFFIDTMDIDEMQKNHRSLANHLLSVLTEDELLEAIEEIMQNADQDASEGTTEAEDSEDSMNEGAI